jgi:hypothetical protein
VKIWWKSDWFWARSSDFPQNAKKGARKYLEMLRAFVTLGTPFELGKYLYICFFSFGSSRESLSLMFFIQIFWRGMTTNEVINAPRYQHFFTKDNGGMPSSPFTWVDIICLNITPNAGERLGIFLKTLASDLGGGGGGGTLSPLCGPSVNRWEICLSMREQNESRNSVEHAQRACLQKGALV